MKAGFEARWIAASSQFWVLTQHDFFYSQMRRRIVLPPI
jgi:hypothetical protein